MPAGQGLDSQKRRSWIGKIQIQIKETIRDTETLWDGTVKLSTTQGEGQSIRASCRSEGTVNKPHRQVLQPPVVCLRPPTLKRGWGWLILTGFMWAWEEGMETCKKVVMKQQLSLTRAQVRPQQKHANTHSSIHLNMCAPTPLNQMFVWSRGEGWGRGCSCRQGGLSKKWTNKTPENQIPLLLSRRHSETLSVQVMWL